MKKKGLEDCQLNKDIAELKIEQLLLKAKLCCNFAYNF